MFLPEDQIYRSWVVDHDYSLVLEEIAQIADYGIGLYLKKIHSEDRRLPREAPDESFAPIGPTPDWKHVPARRKNGRAIPQMAYSPTAVLGGRYSPLIRYDDSCGGVDVEMGNLPSKANRGRHPRRQVRRQSMKVRRR